MKYSFTRTGKRKSKQKQRLGNLQMENREEIKNAWCEVQVLAETSRFYQNVSYEVDKAQKESIALIDHIINRYISEMGVE